MKRLFALDAGNVENVAYLPPLAGNFKGVTDVEIHNESDAARPATGSNTDTGGDNPQPDAPPSSARSSGDGRRIR